jgi:membrane protease YdiL (CAAX protease family)
VLVSQGILLGLALLAARTNGVALFPPARIDALRTAAFLVFMTVAIAALFVSWRWRSEKSRKRLQWIAPANPRELVWWGAICIMAGITEEIVFRGVMFELVRRLIVEPLTAYAVCVAAFAASHLVQGWGAVAATAAFGAAFHLVVWLTGDLYTAMAIHIGYNFAAGIILMFLTRIGNPAIPSETR